MLLLHWTTIINDASAVSLPCLCVHKGCWFKWSGCIFENLPPEICLMLLIFGLKRDKFLVTNFPGNLCQQEAIKP